MEDPNTYNDGPPRDAVPLESYTVQLGSESTAQMLPIHSPDDISGSLIAYLTAEMNDEVSELV
jgi:hypothetical protein